MSNIDHMETKQLPGKTFLGVMHDKLSMNDMKEAFEKGYGQVGAYVGQNGVQVVGPPVGMYADYDPTDHTMKTLVAFEVAPGTTVAEDSGLTVVETVEGDALFHQHVGNYDGLQNVHAEMTKHLEENALQMGEWAIEVYMTDPAQETDESMWVTDVYYQLV